MFPARSLGKRRAGRSLATATKTEGRTGIAVPLAEGFINRLRPIGASVEMTATDAEMTTTGVEMTTTGAGMTATGVEVTLAGSRYARRCLELDGCFCRPFRGYSTCSAVRWLAETVWELLDNRERPDLQRRCMRVLVA